jgi:hypothetical protein
MGKGLAFFAWMAMAAGPPYVELVTSMKIDVDGAPNAYGPPGKLALDYELNAHVYVNNKPTASIVGYLTKEDFRTPVIQGAKDPYPGYYISATGFSDDRNPNKFDPLKYVDATKINYVVMGSFAKEHHARLGDFVTVYSKKHKKSVYGIIGDSGNATGAEGSLALLQALGYEVENGKAGSVINKEIVIRYFPGSNPKRAFFKTQPALDQAAAGLGLNKDFAAK